MSDTTKKKTKKYKRPNPSPPPVSFYLGSREEAARRKESLEKIANQFNVTRSVLLKMIADGELIVTSPQ